MRKFQSGSLAAGMTARWLNFILAFPFRRGLRKLDEAFERFRQRAAHENPGHFLLIGGGAAKIADRIDRLFRLLPSFRQGFGLDRLAAPPRPPPPPPGPRPRRAPPR